MAAIQQWWLGLARKREIIPAPPALQYLLNWFVGSGSLVPVMIDGTVSTDVGTWEIDEGSYMAPQPSYSTLLSENTSTDEVVLVNTGGSKIIMEVMFNVGAGISPGDYVVSFSANSEGGYINMTGAEGTGFALPGQIVFSCSQTSGGGDGPHWTPDPFTDYRVTLEWNADEGPSGTARWFVDGEEWGTSTTIGNVDVIDNAVFDDINYTANAGNTYYASLYCTEGPGFNAIDWTADADGNIGGTPEPVSIDYDNFAHGSDWQVTTPNGFGNAQTNYVYSQRAGMPSGGVEFQLNAVSFSDDVNTRPGLIHHDVNNDGWAFDVGIDNFVTNGRYASITKWNSGRGLGTLFYNFVVSDGVRDLRAHIGNNEARIYMDDVLVAYGPHLTEEVNFSSSIRNIIFSGGRFQLPNAPESTHVGSARVRNLAFPNPSSVVSMDYSLLAGYEAAYTAIAPTWAYWPHAVGTEDQGSTSRTLTSNDISFDGTGCITLTPEGSSGTMYITGTENLGTEGRVVMEFTIRSIAAGSRVAVGVYCPGVGPTPDYDQYLAGFSSGFAYYENTGHIDGYGGVNAGDYATFEAGDIVSAVAVGAYVQFLKNGVEVGLPVSLINSSTVTFMVSVGPE